MIVIFLLLIITENPSSFVGKDWLEIRADLQDQSPELPKLKLWGKSRKAFLYLLQGEDLVYGYACDVVGVPPLSCIAISHLIKRKKVNAIRYLLRHGKPVAKIYSVVALEYFRKLGYQFPKEDEEIIKSLFGKKFNVDTCNGCDYSYHYLVLSKREIEIGQKNLSWLLKSGFSNFH